MVETLLTSLGLTLLLELCYAWLWGVKGTDCLIILLMNILTNPPVVLWHCEFQELSIWMNTVFPELAAICVEIFLLIKFGKQIKKPVMLGICINVFSFFAGFVLNLCLL